MKLHEFYAKFANTPLSERFTSHEIVENGYGESLSLSQIYVRLNLLEDRIRKDKKSQEEILLQAEKFMK